MALASVNTEEQQKQQTAATGGGRQSSGGYAAFDAAQNPAYTQARQALYDVKGAAPAAWDPATDASYQAALAALKNAEQNAPAFANTYGRQVLDAYNAIVNRPRFQYDVDGDALYQQYRDQYVTQGRRAMQDALGQAAHLTGGYASSYAQGVGQQTYDAYLQQLNAVIPELEQRAYSRYQDEGNELAQRYAMLRDLDATEYGRYQDDLANWQTERAYAQGNEQQAYSRGQAAASDAYDRWTTQYGFASDAEREAYNRALAEYQQGYAQKQYQDTLDQQAWENSRAEDETAYGRQQDVRSYLLALISGAGYSPTDEELAAAGMTRAQADALLAAYQQSLSSGYGGGYSGGYGSGNDAMYDLAGQYLAGSSSRDSARNTYSTLQNAYNTANTAKTLDLLGLSTNATSYLNNTPSQVSVIGTQNAANRTKSSGTSAGKSAASYQNAPTYTYTIPSTASSKSTSNTSASSLSANATKVYNTLKSMRGDGATNAALNKELTANLNKKTITTAEARRLSSLLGLS